MAGRPPEMASPTPDQIVLVRASAARVAHVERTTAELFRARALEVAPQARPVLDDYASAQVAAALMRLAAEMEDLAALAPPARNLAARLVACGVTPAHYGPIADAALWALRHSLGDAFDAQTEDAWDALIHAVAAMMVSSAYQRAGAA